MKTLTIGGRTHPNRRGVKIGTAIFIDKDEYENFVDASSANAEASNIEYGYSGYVGTRKVNGTLNKIKTFARSSLKPSWVNNTIQLTASPTMRNIVDSSTSIELSLDANELGEADDNTVLNGVTYTSKNGLKRTGKMSSGIDTSDATAEESNVETGKTFYRNGIKYTGNISVVGSASKASFGSSGVSASGTNLLITAKNTVKRILSNGTSIEVSAPLSSFGDASDSDVSSGKTYTSSNGLNRTGSLSALTSTDKVTLSSPTIAVSGSNLLITASNTIKRVFANGTKIEVSSALGSFGTAAASDVAYGKTFTSEAGYKTKGTALLTQTLLFREEMSWGTTEIEATLPINLGNILAQDTGYTIGIAMRLRRQTTAAGSPFEIRTVIPLQIYTSTFVLPPANSCVVNVLKDINSTGSSSTVEGYVDRGIYIKSVSQDGSNKINVNMAWDNNSGLAKGGVYSIECWAIRVPYRYA